MLIAPHLGAHAVPRRGGQAVTNDFSLKRAAAFNSAKKVVASERFRLLLISLAESVENKQSYSRRHDCNRASAATA
jgi:hypothetical protein